MLKGLCEEQYLALLNKLDVIAENENTPIQKLAAALRAIRDCIDSLWLWIKDHPFAAKDAEIEFIKNEQPRFYCHLILQVELFNLHDRLPCGRADQVKAYFEQELLYSESLFRQNAFLYQYFRTGMVEMDGLYFVRGEDLQSMLIPEVPELNPQRSTSCGYLFAKFMAFELLQKHLLGRLDGLSGSNGGSDLLSKKDMLCWTGDKVNLAEIIYGLFYTGQLNNGNAGLAQIIKWMELNLNIDLGGRTYRDFGDIRRRKRDSPTRFLDKMRDSINQRIDDDNAYKPVKKTGEPTKRPE